MAEEFQESDVVFSDHYSSDNDNSCQLLQEMVLSNNSSGVRVASGTSNKKNIKKKKSTAVNSVPVNINIPDNRFQYGDRDDDKFEEEYDEDGEIVPPHVIIARRIAGKMAFSVGTSNGRRTLKGRDLSQLRNSILRMTGFLET